MCFDGRNENGSLKKFDRIQISRFQLILWYFLEYSRNLSVLSKLSNIIQRNLKYHLMNGDKGLNYSNMICETVNKLFIKIFFLIERQY